MLTDTTTSFYNATSKLAFRIFVFAIWYIIQFIIGCAILWYTYYHVIGFFIDQVINPLEGQEDNYIGAILIIVLSILIVSLPTVLAFYLMQPVFRIENDRSKQKPNRQALRVHFYGLNGNGRYRGHPRRPAFHSGKSPLRPPAPVGR